MWEQVYLPFSSFYLSVAFALVPLFSLLILLVALKMKGHLACGLTLLITILNAWFIWKMPPILIASSVTNGMAFGLFPIGWIILHAIWLYNMTVESGQFDILKNYLSFLTEDRRLQAVLIGFVFAVCLEATAGFGIPVAISAALLIGMGFPKMLSATIALVSNSATVVFGALALPLTVGAEISGVDTTSLSQISSLQLIPLCALTPFILSWIVAGFKKSWDIVWILLGSGFFFALVQYGVSWIANPYLPQLIASFALFFVFCTLLRYWQPDEIWRFPEDQSRNSVTAPPSLKSVLVAGLPFLVLGFTVFFWADLQYTGFKNYLLELEKFLFNPSISWPFLHESILKVPPIVDAPTPYNALFSLNLLSTPGTAILLSGLVSIPFIKNYSFQKAAGCYGRTFYQLRFALMTLPMMLGIAYLLNYSGMSSTIGLLFVSSGSLFPVFSALIGYIGLFMTGSETSTNALFGLLQSTTADKLSMNPTLAISTNMVGGGTAKMIAPQIITVAAGSTGLVGREGELLLKLYRISFAFLLIISCYTWLLAQFI